MLFLNKYFENLAQRLPPIPGTGGKVKHTIMTFLSTNEFFNDTGNRFNSAHKFFMLRINTGKV